MLHFLLDIDGAMAERNTAVLIALCNKQLRLGIDESRLQVLRYPEFLLLPEVMRYRQRMGERNFERALHWLELDPHHLIHMYPLKGAVAGATRLANMGSVTYYSSRKTPSSQALNEQMARATHLWLALHHFPHPDNVLFYDRPQDKLCQITQLTERSDYRLVVIDAHYEQVLATLSSLSQFMLKRVQRLLTLYAFGTTEVIGKEAIEVIAFPSWEYTDACVEAWIDLVEQKLVGASHYQKRWR